MWSAVLLDEFFLSGCVILYYKKIWLHAVVSAAESGCCLVVEWPMIHLGTSSPIHFTQILTSRSVLFTLVFRLCFESLGASVLLFCWLMHNFQYFSIMLFNCKWPWTRWLVYIWQFCIVSSLCTLSLEY